MNQQVLHTITAKLLSLQHYFDSGFCNAYKLSNGYVVGLVDGNEKRIFPQDKYGSYFYIRNARSASVVSYKISDCLNGSIYKSTPSFVAVIGQDVCRDNAIQNIIAVLNSVHGVTVNSVSWDSERVIIDEMSGADRLDIDAALQRLKKYTIIKIDFTLSVLPCSTPTVECLNKLC